jgi:amino acid transporter
VGLLFPGGTPGRTFGAHRTEYTMRRLIRRIIIVGLVAVLGAYALAALALAGNQQQAALGVRLVRGQPVSDACSGEEVRDAARVAARG